MVLGSHIRMGLRMDSREMGENGTQDLVTSDREMHVHYADRKVAMRRHGELVVTHGELVVQMGFHRGVVVKGFGVQLEGVSLNSSTVSCLWRRKKFRPIGARS
jgi:hypothetical protein